MSFIDIDIRQKIFTTTKYLKASLRICAELRNILWWISKNCPFGPRFHLWTMTRRTLQKTFSLFRTQSPPQTPPYNESTLILTMSACKICDQNLTIELDPEEYYPSHTPHKPTWLTRSPSFDEASGSAAGGSSTIVPDDLQLTCGCHFHW